MPTEGNAATTDNETRITTASTDGLVPSADIAEQVAATPYPAMPGLSPVFWSVVGATALVLGGLGVMVWRARSQPAEVFAPKVATKQNENHQEVATQVLDGNQSLEDSTKSSPAQPEATVTENLSNVDRTIAEAVDRPLLPEPPSDEDHDAKSAANKEALERNPTVESTVEESALPAVSPTVSEHESATKGSSPAAVLRFDPLDFDPARLTLGNGAVTVAQPSTSSTPTDIDEESKSEPLEAGNEEESLPPKASINPTLSVRVGPKPSETGGPKGISQLALRIDSISLENIPLCALVDMVAEMAGVPVTLDPIELQLAGVSPTQPVSVQAKNKTLENVLTDVLSKLRLELTEQQGQLRIILAGGGRQRFIEHDWKDLIDGEDAQSLMTLLQHFIAPNSWRGHGGNGTIVLEKEKIRIEQTQHIQHEILVFVERLRLARGLPLRSRYPVNRLNVQSPYSLIADRLNQRTTFTFLSWARLADVVRHWQETSGMNIIVDWAALAEAGLSPATLVACSAIDRTWEDVFDGILNPLGMAWWAVDGETIQVTTINALKDLRRIEFYAVPNAQVPSADAQTFRDVLRKELQSGNEAASLTPRNTVYFELDKPSGQFIVLAPPTAHRVLAKQLEKEKPAK
jgi:hypothetical protein